MVDYNTYESLLKKFIEWSKKVNDIRAAVVVGSRARSKVPADEWSDLDLVIFSTKPDYYISSTEWLQNIGQYWMTFVENTAVGESKERRVLFEGGLDVDFSVFSVNDLEKLFEMPEVQMVFERGMKIVLDKDNLFIDFTLTKKEIEINILPEENDFVNLINDFWYHAVLSVKKLLRGELWTAKMIIDNYMKWKLLKLVEWHTIVTNGMECDTWHDGRFFDSWADPRIIDQIRICFAHYNKEDIKKALIETMNLFRWIAIETSEMLEYKYSYKADKKATAWINSHLS